LFKKIISEDKVSKLNVQKEEVEIL